MSKTEAELQSNTDKKPTFPPGEDARTKRDLVRSLTGSLPCDITLEEAREERLSKI